MSDLLVEFAESRAIFSFSLLEDKEFIITSF